MRLVVSLLTTAWIAASPSAASAQPAPPTPPRYLESIRTELEAMRIPATCEAESALRARCTYRHRGRQRELPIHVVYSDETDTIYFYVERYLLAPPEAESTPAVLRRLMEINWQMLLGKLEWDASDGEVRLSMVVNTDSNFDRRTFRSVVRAIGPLAERYLPELERLAAED
jgi:hypothetical protein